MLTTLSIMWSAVTVILVVFMIYRSMLANHEEDQLFLSDGEQNKAKEQHELQAKLVSVGRYTMALGAVSGVLLVVLVGVWAYESLPS